MRNRSSCAQRPPPRRHAAGARHTAGRARTGRERGDKKHFAYKPFFKDAFDGTDEADCEMFLKPGEHLDADDNSRIIGSDLSDAKVLDALVTAAAGSCADLAGQFNVNDPVLGTPGFPFEGPEAL